MQRPGRDEYVDYYHQYVSKVPDGDILDYMEQQCAEFVSFIRDIPADKGDYRYAEGKWSIKDVVGHVTDTERVFGYRVLIFSRGERTPLPAWDQEISVEGANFAARTLDDLVDEFAHHRQSLMLMFRSFDDDIAMRRGLASGFEFTVRSIPYILAGHVNHHAAVLRERYL